MTETMEFTAKRRKAVEDAYEVLLGVVKSALDANDYTPIITEVMALWNSIHDGDDETAEQVFESVLTDSLNQTSFTEPDSDARFAQVERIALWLASFAVNDATYASLNATGVGKEWVSMHDSKVRETHRAVDGTVVLAGEAFVVGGTPMRYPGEPVGDPDLWMGCRCVLRASTNVTAAAPVLEEDEEEVMEDLADSEFDPVPWHGVLAPLGVMSGDKRMFAEDAEVTTRDLPIPMKYMKKDKMGHEDSVVVANITKVWVSDGLILAEGFFADTEEAAEAIAMRAQDMMRGVSVDLDMTEQEFRDVDGNPVDIFELGPDDAEPIMVVTKLRIAAATQCAIPAFQEAYYDLGTWADELVMQEDCEDCDEDIEEELDAISASAEPFPYGNDDQYRDYSPEERDAMAKDGRAMPDGSFPIADEEDLKNAIQAIGRAKDPEAAKKHIKKRAKALGKADLLPDDWAALTQTFAPGTKDGPGWLTDPVPTARIRRYWVHGKGAAKIRWGVPGDFNRCRRQLAKYIDNPAWLAGTCANMHKEALGFWPGRPLSLEGEQMAPAFTEVSALTASAGDLPPKSWFEDPQLSGPTPLTITEDGRIYGHVAAWGTCHIGSRGRCIEVPTSPSNYAYFHTGAVNTDGGLVPVGHITMETGHADLSLSATATMAHYDNTAMVAADVCCGDDVYGVWISGKVRDRLTDEERFALQAATLSGDWREVSGNLEMVAALAVNVPGFPIPRVAVAASGFTDVALVAAGMVLADEEEEVTQEDVIGSIVRKAISEYRSQEKAMEALPDLRQHFAKGEDERIQAIKDYFKENADV